MKYEIGKEYYLVGGASSIIAASRNLVSNERLQRRLAESNFADMQYLLSYPIENVRFMVSVVKISVVEFIIVDGSIVPIYYVGDARINHEDLFITMDDAVNYADSLLSEIVSNCKKIDEKIKQLKVLSKKEKEISDKKTTDKKSLFKRIFCSQKE